MLVLDPVLDLVLAAFGDPEAGLEVDVAVDLVALDFHDAVDVLVELHDFGHGMMGRTPALANFEVVKHAVDDAR